MTYLGDGRGPRGCFRQTVPRSVAEVLRAPHAPERHLMDSDTDLLAHFMRYFEILRADTPALLEDVFRLRYQVYCVEGAVSGFEPGDYPDGLERDVYDARSLHCLLRHRESDRYAGTLRLVCADAARVDAPFPLEVVSGQQMECEYLSIAGQPRHCIAECSRFILARQFRSRRGEQQWADGLAEVTDVNESIDERRAATHPILGLMKAGTMMSWEQGIHYWYAGMEPRMDRRLRRFGLVLEPVSPLIDYFGPCRVYWGCLPAVFERMREQRPDVWRLLTGNGEIWPIGYRDGCSVTARPAQEN